MTSTTWRTDDPCPVCGTGLTYTDDGISAIIQVLAAIQGERRWRGCVAAGERGFRGGSGCGRVVCDDTVSVSGLGRPSP